MKTIEQIYSAFLESSQVVTDSRKVEKNSMFFALRGENFDGNKFAKQTLDNGAKYVVVESWEHASDERVILVSDTLRTLQKLAQYHRSQLQIPIIGITGTNGKTTTKELLLAVLSQKLNVYATEGNLNNQIGVPLTILKINQKHELAIIEMGASHIGDIAELCEIAQPNHGLITNIGVAHLEGFGSREAIKQTKKELYDALNSPNSTIFFNPENPILCDILTSNSAQKSPYPKASAIASSEPFLKLNLEFDNTQIPIQTQIFGAYNLENIRAAVCAGLHFGVPMEKIVAAIENYLPKNSRSQITSTPNNRLLLDLYNASPSSMMAALTSFFELNAPNAHLILGDMLELGENSIDEHYKILEFIKLKNFNKVFLVGENFSQLQPKFPDFLYFLDTKALENYIKNNPLTKKFIMLKASRGLHFEALLPLL